MAVTLEELTEFGWEDYLNEEMYEDALENYVEQITDRVTDLENSSLTEDMEEKRKVKNKITVVSEEALKKAHTYVELNFGRSYLSPAEEQADELSDVPRHTRRLYSVFYRRNP